MRLRYTTRALAEIEHLQDYIARRNPSAAVRMADLIRMQLATLLSHPDKGRLGRVAGTRELVITGTPYLAAYRAQEREILVLAVIHGAQRWPESL